MAVEVRVRRTWVRAGWILAVGLGVSAVGLGVPGATEFLNGRRASYTGWDVAYVQLQLFALEGGDFTGSLPWTLTAAKFLAPAATVATALAAAAALLRARLDVVRAAVARRHEVVAGLGSRGLTVVRSLLGAGHSVVVVERDEESPAVGALRRDGVPVIVGDARDPEVLRRASLTRASHLIAFCGDDATNAEVAVAARSLGRADREAALGIFAHIGDPDLCSSLQLRELADEPGTHTRLEFFNVVDVGARELAFDLDAEAGERAAHVVIVGTDDFARRLTLHLHRRWLLDEGSGARAITLVGRRASEVLAAVPHSLRSRVSVAAVDVDEAPATLRQGKFLDGVDRPTRAVVSLEQTAASLSVALGLDEVLAGAVPVTARTEHLDGSHLLASASQVAAFPLVDRTSNAAAVLGGVYEILARAAHADYVASERRAGRGDPGSPSQLPWDHLDEALKESNRDLAGHVGVKLRAVGCSLAPLRDIERADFRFDDDELEQLAELEHERWVAERRRSGWTEGPRDLEARTSPYLVSYDQLSDEVKEQDRAMVRGMPRFLARAGFEIVRVTS